MNWGLKSVFYYLFFFLAAVFLANAIIFLIHHTLRKTLKNEFFRLKRANQFRLPKQREILIGSLWIFLLCGIVFSYLLFKRPIFGLLVFLFLPAILRLITQWRMWVRRWEFDEAALSFLVALRGLVHVGMSLPTALFQISKSSPSGFAQHLARHLNRFEEGHSLGETLLRFQKRAGLGHSAIVLTLLEMAYARGLQAGPILDQIIPLLESERHAEKRVWDLRKSTLFQAVTAFCLPWALGSLLIFFQPEIMERFLQSGMFYGVGGIALLFQCLGVFILWRLSAFY